MKECRDSKRIKEPSDWKIEEKIVGKWHSSFKAIRKAYKQLKAEPFSVKISWIESYPLILYFVTCLRNHNRMPRQTPGARPTVLDIRAKAEIKAQVSDDYFNELMAYSKYELIVMQVNHYEPTIQGKVDAAGSVVDKGAKQDNWIKLSDLMIKIHGMQLGGIVSKIETIGKAIKVIESNGPKQRPATQIAVHLW